MLKVEQITVQGTTNMEDLLIDGPISKAIREREKQVISTLSGNGEYREGSIVSAIRAVMASQPLAPLGKKVRLSTLISAAINKAARNNF